MDKVHVTEIGARIKPTKKVDDNFWHWYGKELTKFLSFKWLKSMIIPTILTLTALCLLGAYIVVGYILEGYLPYWYFFIAMPFVITSIAYWKWFFKSCNEEDNKFK